jgi:hypothetical protein
MRTLWKGLVVGALVGGAVKAAREVREGEGTVDDLAVAVGRSAGQAALAGAAVGFMLDRRSRRRRSKFEKARAAARSKVSLGSVVAGAGALADAARPHVEHAADLAKVRAAKAAVAAKPRLDAMGDAAKAKLAELDLPVLVAV